MRTSRTALRWGARVVTAGVGAAATAAAIAAATLLPWPQMTFPAPQTVVTPVPTEQVLACPGPLLALAANAADATSATSIGPAESAYSTQSGEPQTPPLTVAAAELLPGDGSPSAITLAVPADATDAPALGGSQSQFAETEEITGLAATACGEPAADSWLVAGSTSLGQASLLLLANPTAVEAKVQLTLYGPQGVVGEPVAVSVAAGAQSMIPLAGLGGELDATVVHVQATGGQVYASMQQSRVSGLTPEGVELVGPSAAPATRQTIVGMAVRGIDAVRQFSGAEGYSPMLPSLRVLAPGSAEAHINVSVAPVGTSGSGTTWQGEVAGDTVVEVPLEDLTDGDYTVTVTSDTPVVAAARTSTLVEDQRDFGWFAAGTTLAADAVAAVTGPATLHLANLETVPITVTMAAPGGAQQEVAVPAGQTIAVPLLTSGGHLLQGAKGLLASVTYASPGALASFTVGSAGSLAAPLTIYPR